jgi:hypothetical protein
MQTETTFDLAAFVDSYVNVWNDRDPASRRDTVVKLWAEDGVEVTDQSRYLGHDDIEARITRAHDELVGRDGFAFSSAGDASAHDGAVRFTVQMRPAAGGEINWTCAVVALLDDEGRIREDHQFANPPAADAGTLR